MKLTVGQYQELWAIAKSEDLPEDKSTQSIAVVTGKTPAEVDDLPLNEYKLLDREIAKSLNELRLNTKPVSFLKVGKKLYQVNYKVGRSGRGRIRNYSTG